MIEARERICEHETDGDSPRLHKGSDSDRGCLAARERACEHAGWRHHPPARTHAVSVCLSVPVCPQHAVCVQAQTACVRAVGDRRRQSVCLQPHTAPRQTVCVHPHTSTRIHLSIYPDTSVQSCLSIKTRTEMVDLKLEEGPRGMIEIECVTSRWHRV